MNFGRHLEQLWADLEAGDAQAVHAVRKLTRRAQAALEVQGVAKKQQRAWRDLRRAIAPVRDWDAVGVHLRASLKALEIGAEGLKRFDTAWAEERAARWRQVELPLPPDPPPVSGHRHIRRHLHARWEQFGQQAPAVLASDDEIAWHSLRKHLKGLRYVWEQLGDVPSLLVAMLDALGRVQDAHVAREALRERAVPRPLRARLLAREQAAQAAAQQEARRLWPLVAQLDVP